MKAKVFLLISWLQGFSFSHLKTLVKSRAASSQPDSLVTLVCFPLIYLSLTSVPLTALCLFGCLCVLDCVWACVRACPCLHAASLCCCLAHFTASCSRTWGFIFHIRSENFLLSFWVSSSLFLIHVWEQTQLCCTLAT